MKNKILLTAGIYFLLYLPTMYAQNGNRLSDFRDTLAIKPNADIQIFFIGNTLEKMAKYKKADSLKTLLIDDWEKAKQESSYPAASKTTHYFVDPNGKRRLKAESDDYQEPALDIRKEIRSLRLNLPLYEFIIYDLANNYEIHVYLNKPEQLVALKNISLNEAIFSIAGNAQAQRRYYRVDLENINGQWKMSQHFSSRKLEIGVTSCINLSVFGSQLSPGIIMGGCLTLYDKRAIPLYGIDLLYNTNFVGGDLNYNWGSINYIESIDLRILSNISYKGKYRTRRTGSGDWLGVNFGYMLPSGTNDLLDNKFKYGISLYFNRFNLTLDGIYTDSDVVVLYTVEIPLFRRNN